jgi:transposase
MTVSEYMTTAEVAEFARCSVKTVERGWAAYRKSGGQRGLRATQRGGAYSTLLIHRDDAKRWVEGEPPVSGSRKLRRSA